MGTHSVSLSAPPTNCRTCAMVEGGLREEASDRIRLMPKRANGTAEAAPRHSSASRSSRCACAAPTQQGRPAAE
eukprot:7661761-Alexandrium_andersonii.AAC.1